MDSEEIASTLNMMPDHLKGTAKQKFKDLSGFAHSSAQEITKISSQAFEKVEEISSDIKTKVILTKENLSDKLHFEKGSQKKVEVKLEKVEQVQQTVDNVEISPLSPLLTWFTEHGSDFGRWMFLCVFIYIVGYFHWSFVYIIIAIASSYAHQILKNKKKEQLDFARQMLEIGEEKAIKMRVDELSLPSWFQFPDVERVEWINTIGSILWPHLTAFLENLIRRKIEPVARETLESYRLWGFRFDKIIFGNEAPRLEGLKVYTTPGDNEIIADLEVKFTSAVDSRISISLLKVGASLSDIHFSGKARIILKPMIDEPPFVGGVQVFFLSPPAIEFDLGGAAQVLDLPGINGLLKSAIDNAISDQLVNPNRLSFILNDKVSPVDLKMPKPIGVILVEIIEAKNLPKMDVGFSRCDPYVIVSHGSNDKRTKVGSGLNPVWKETIAFPIEIPESQLQVVVLDKDTLSGDDFIGQTKINVSTVIEAEGYIDTWISLESSDGTGESRGEVRFKMSWLKATTNREDYKEENLYPALLTIYLDSVQTRPIYSDVPEVCVKMTVGKSDPFESSLVLGRDPVFQEGRIMMLKKVVDEVVDFKIFDMADDEEDEIASYQFPLSKLTSSDDLGIPLLIHELQDWKGRIKFAAQLKYLAPPPSKEDKSTALKRAFGIAGSSKRLARKTMGTVSRNVRSGVARTTENVIKKIPSPMLRSKQAKVEAKNRPIPMETNFDVEEEGAHKTHGDKKQKDSSDVTEIQKVKPSSIPVLDKKTSYDSASDDNGNSQNNNNTVRRRLSDGFRSFSFRK